jgi:hypothetical protein
VVWDEKNLDINEKERPEGGYQKIDEPKTPYRYEEEDDMDEKDDQVDPEIEAVLQQAKEQMEKEVKKSDFAAKRKMHYKTEEGDVLRKMKEKKEMQKISKKNESEDSSF